MSVFPGAAAGGFAKAPTGAIDVYGPRDWQDNGGRHAISPTPVAWNMGINFPANPYVGIGYHMEARFFGDPGPLSGQGIEGGVGETRSIKLNIGGFDLVTLVNANDSNRLPDSGWFTITVSGAIVLYDWYTASGSGYSSTHLQYRFVRP